MGFLDTLKAKLSPAREKVGDLAHQHGEKIDHGIDKAARTVDEKTKGKYSEKIESGTRKAKEAVERLSHTHEDGKPGEGDATPGQSEGTPPSTPPPAS
ncbi:antitoxin [Streptomyces sp. NPDC047987]|uniref:antitoxin n=1 Tax=unclassified Streptomyces TaxID=2593676 RepID=UPI00342E2E25